MKCFKSILLVVLVVGAGASQAQDYLLTARGDSITGEIRPLLYGPDKKVQVVAADKEKTTFSIFQVREFAVDGDIYHPIKGERGYEFMKLMKPGYLSLYAFQLENQSRFDGLLLRKIDGDFLVVPNLGFKKYLSRFLEDCPSLVQQLDAGTLGKRDLNTIIDTYNTCINNLTPNVVVRQEQHAKLSAWHSLEEKIKETNFEDKANALEMVAEIRKKVERRESIPNFLVEGLRRSLRDTGLSDELENALSEAQ